MVVAFGVSTSPKMVPLLKSRLPAAIAVRWLVCPLTEKEDSRTPCPAAMGPSDCETPSIQFHAMMPNPLGSEEPAVPVAVGAGQKLTASSGTAAIG